VKSTLREFLKLGSASGILVGSMISRLQGVFNLSRTLAAKKSDNTLAMGDNNA
jgi:hypothetical protein